MLDVLLIIIFFASLIGILYIVLSKFPQLASIRLDIIPSEQQLTIRNRIVANRLRGKFASHKNKVIKNIRPFWLNFTSLFWKIYSKILEKERHLQYLAMTPEERATAKSKIDELLVKAQAATKEHRFMRAERLYINIINLDQQNLDAYDGLAQMYWQQKDYQKMNETLKFLVNLTKKRRRERLKAEKETADIDAKLAQYYLKLGELCQYQGDNEGALRNFLEIIKIDANNPKALDQLLEISIILRKIDLAQETLDKIRENDPNNQKIGEWERRIEEFE
jgi:hypothetical protein